MLNNYAHIFELLSRLRQAVDHPWVTNGIQITHASEVRSDVCGICGMDIPTLSECSISACRHTFHKTCILEHIELIETGNQLDKDEIAVQQALDKDGTTKTTLTKSSQGSQGSKGSKGSKTATSTSKSKSKSKSKKSKKKDAIKVGCPVCYLPLSVVHNLRAGSSGTQKTSNKNNQEDDNLCIICMDRPAKALLIPCGHLYTCSECIATLREQNNSCPLCRTTIQKVLHNQTQDKKTTENKASSSSSSSTSSTSSSSTSSSSTSTSSSLAPMLGRRSIMQKIKVENFASSTKVDALLHGVQKMLKKDSTNKAIVFSQYIRMLDILEWKLMTSGIKVVKLMGYMPLKERQSVLARFKTDPNISVILMSLKTGGEGLNIQEASHVFSIEPWWNPAVEMQAICRSHRLGQKKPVTAIRFITKDSIEDRMLELQKKKELVFEGTIDSSAAALAQLTADDLSFLFS